MAQALSDAGKGEELTTGDLAILTRERAQAAGTFPRSMGAIETRQEINQWVMGELITLETRQSLEGLGLMTVGLKRDPSVQLRGFTALGLDEDEAWALLNVLVKTVRMQGALQSPRTRGYQGRALRASQHRSTNEVHRIGRQEAGNQLEPQWSPRYLQQPNRVLGQGARRTGQLHSGSLHS